MSLQNCLRQRWVALVVSLVLSPLTLAQNANDVATHARESLQPGIVVENVAKYSEAEKAGLESGDVLLDWTRGGSKGTLDSPFDLTWTQIEQSPLGTVTLEGLRSGEKNVWSLGPDDWGLTTRPNFTGIFLALYREGADLAAKNKMEAAAHWKVLAGRISASSHPPWLPAWLFLRGAELLRDAKQWKETDDAYQSAVQSASGAGPVVEGQILKAWGSTYQQRSDWANAEKYFQQSLEKIKGSGGGELGVATLLDALGAVARQRGDFGKADQYYHHSLEIQEKPSPESLAVAVSVSGLGGIAWQRGDLTLAGQYYRRALEIRERLAPESLLVAASLTSLGKVAWRRGDLAQAEQYHRQALEIRQKLAPGSLDAAESLDNLGIVAWQRGDLTMEEDYFRQALEIREKLAPGELPVAASLNNVGLALKDRGDLAGAEDYYRRALEIQQRLAPESIDAAMGLNNLGVVAAQRGDLTKAEQYYRQSLELRERLAPGSLDVAASLSNLGLIAWQQGDLANAAKYYGQALTIREKLAPDSLDVAKALNGLGSVAFDQGDWDNAEKYHNRALAIRQKSAPESLAVAESFINLGMLASRRGDLSKSEQYYGRAVTIDQKLAPDSLDIAEVLQRLGDLSHKSQDQGKAERYYRQALTIREKWAPGSSEHAESLAAVASVLRDQDQLDAAAQFYAQAVAALESQTARLGGSEEVRSGFRASHTDIYRDYVDLLLAQQKSGQAFEVLERSRARILLETLMAAHVDIRTGADPTLLEQEGSVRELLAAKSDRRLRLLGAKGNEKQLAALTQEIEDLDKQYYDVEERLRLNSPGYASLTQPRTLTAREIQQLLDPATLLLEYSLGEERSYVFAVTPETVTARELPKRLEVEDLARHVFDLLQSRKRIRGESVSQTQARWAKADADYWRSAGRLSQLILGPIAAQLADKRLVIVSDGALQYVSFAALPAPHLPGPIKAGATSLLAEHEIVNLPSASVLAALRQDWSERKPARNTVAVFADPVFSSADHRLRPDSDGHTDLHAASRRDSTAASESVPPDGLTRSALELGVSLDGIFPRLRFSRREAEAIDSIAGRHGATEALDFKANKAAATDVHLKDYRILHFATHGLLNSQHPDLSGLVFSLVDAKGRKQDGFVRLSDIYNLELNADLVVLSACQTALGKQIEGEGLVGMTRGFMYAGAERVVASLWNVDDEATAELMAHFYDGILRKGQTPAQALRSAQNWTRTQKRWRSPYYWAGFVLQGEWR